MATQLNPVRAVIAILMARRRARPDPKGTASLDHADFADVLVDLKQMGIASLPENRSRLVRYRDRLAGVDPDTLTRDEALAYWINLYNAGALTLAADAVTENADSVLRMTGAFNGSWVTVGRASLTLTDLEHGKIRGCGDPRGR